MSALDGSQAGEILQRYEADKNLDKAMPLLEITEKKRARILRAHYRKKDGGPVYDADEIDARVNADRLLTLSSALEVVAIATGSDVPIPAATGAKLAAFLSNPQVKDYYEEFYPHGLPVLTRRRLLGQTGKAYLRRAEREAEASSSQVMGWLISFFELDSRSRDDKELEFFLDLLDDYEFDDFSLSEVLDLLEDRDDFVGNFVRAKTGKTIEARALRGLDGFVRFAMDYDDLLQRMRRAPMLRSAFWLHQCYWFGVGGGSVRYTSNRLEKALRRLAKKDFAPDVQRSLGNRMKMVCKGLDNLTRWPGDASPLLAAAKPSLDRWKHSVDQEQERRS